MIRLGLVNSTDFREQPIGGALTFLRRFLRHHDTEKFQTDLIGFDFDKHPADATVNIGERSYRYVSCGHIRLVDGRKPGIPVRMRSFLAGITRRSLFREGGYDVLFVHNVDILFSLAGRTDCPIVLQAHGILENAARFARYGFARNRLFQSLYHRMVGRTLRRCAHLISVNEQGRTYYLEHFPFVGDRITVIPPMVDLARFRPDPEARRRTRTELSIGDSDPVLLFTGRLSKGKNLVFLLDVFRKLIDRHPDIRLIICGDGEYRSILAGKVRQDGLDSVVHFTGRLANDRLPRIFAAADVFVLPSLVEGLSIAVLEALASGLPVVCSDVGDLALAVTNGQNGYVVPDYDADAYATRIEDVLRDHTSMSAQAQVSARRFDAETITRRIEEILSRVALQGRRRAATSASNPEVPSATDGERR
jgi:glycosyltransferase involved in cell wall biosynthesis